MRSPRVSGHALFNPRSANCRQHITRRIILKQAHFSGLIQEGIMVWQILKLKNFREEKRPALPDSAAGKCPAAERASFCSWPPSYKSNRGADSEKYEARNKRVGTIHRPYQECEQVPCRESKRFHSLCRSFQPIRPSPPISILGGERSRFYSFRLGAMKFGTFLLTPTA